MSLDSTIFTDHMYSYFGDYWGIIKQNLIDANAIIAGGSVLAAYSDDIVNDIDIYIYASKAIELVNALTANDMYLMSHENYLRPSYDQSFFRKNNILSRFLLQQIWDYPIINHAIMSRNEAIKTHRIFPDIDIMIIPDPPDGNILDVVTNFDLTFCEIWYDGQNVFAIDPEGVMTKTGTLKKDYVDKLLVSLNRFTVQRLQKYIQKGYHIKYESESKSNTFEKETKNVLSQEEWIVQKLYNYIVFSCRFDKKQALKIICTYPLPKYTLDAFKRILPNLIRETMAISFLDGINTNKDIYMKLLIEAGVKRYPPEYFRYVINILNITRADLEEYKKRHIPYKNPDTYKWKRGDGPLQSEVDAFEFEEVENIDESLMNMDPEQINTTCFDFIMRETYDIYTYLSETNTLLWITKGSTNHDIDIMCFSKDYIQRAVSNKSDWFYECTAPPERYIWLQDSEGRRTNKFDKPMNMFGDTPYVKITINSTGLNGFIPLIQLKKLLQSEHKIYYLDTNDSMSHTINYEHSWQRLNGGPVIGTISSNDCQYGSSILITNLKICRNPEQCLKSLEFITEEHRRLFENNEPQLLEMEPITFEPYVDSIYLNVTDVLEKYTILGPLSENQIKEIVTIQRTYDTDSCLQFMQRKYGNHFILDIDCEINCVRDIPVITPSINDLRIITKLNLPLFITIYVNNNMERQIASSSYDNRVINLINKTINILHTVLSFSIRAKHLSFQSDHFNTFKKVFLQNNDLFSLTLSGIQVPCMPFVSFLQTIPLLTELSLEKCTLDTSDIVFDEDTFSYEYAKALKNIKRYSVSRQTYINKKRQLRYMWKSLEQATNLKSLSLAKNSLFDFNDNKLVAGNAYEYENGDTGIAGLHHLKELTFLDVSFNDFLSSDNYDKIDMFCAMIIDLDKLETLYLKNTNIDRESLDVILETLIRLPHLTYLDISLNDLEEEDFIKIREALPNLRTLVTKPI